MTQDEANATADFLRPYIKSTKILRIELLNSNSFYECPLENILNNNDDDAIILVLGKAENVYENIYGAKVTYTANYTLLPFSSISNIEILDKSLLESSEFDITVNKLKDYTEDHQQ